MKLSIRVNKLPEYMISSQKAAQSHSFGTVKNQLAGKFFLSILSRLPIK